MRSHCEPLFSTQPTCPNLGPSLLLRPLHEPAYILTAQSHYASPIHTEAVLVFGKHHPDLFWKYTVAVRTRRRRLSTLFLRNMNVATDAHPPRYLTAKKHGTMSRRRPSPPTRSGTSSLISRSRCSRTLARREKDRNLQCMASSARRLGCGQRRTGARMGAPRCLTRSSISVSAGARGRWGGDGQAGVVVVVVGRPPPITK